MIETGAAIAISIPIAVALIKLVPQRAKDNGFVKKETHDLQYKALDKSVCRIGSEVEALRESFGSELGGVKDSITNLSVKVAGMGAHE